MADRDQTSAAFDLSGAFDDVFDFEQELDLLASVTVPRTADAMAEAFEAASERIESAISRATRTGQIDFENLITAMLADLARLGANAVLDQVFSGLTGVVGQAAPIAVHVNVPQGSDGASLVSAQGQIAAALSQAVLSGGRFS